MNNVTRWVQNANHSLKRSISSVTTPPSPFSGAGNSNSSLNKNWIHQPDVLTYARVEYTVKFLGDRPVTQPKGTEVIKNTIQKLRFDLQVKRSQGFKLPRVELHINLDGVNIVDAKSKIVLYKYPLHRISFCADDKNDKRLFAFIVKQSADSDEHRCFVFLSDKLAEEITLTIGEAFDLAYRKFLENNGRDLELKKLVVVLRKRIGELEHENADLKQQLAQQQRAVSQQMVASAADETIPRNTTDNHHQKSWESFDAPSPLPPSSPIPPPPSHLQTPPPPYSAVAAAVPKKPVDQRLGHGPGPKSSTLDVMRDLSTNAPDVGRRLENLQLGLLEDIYDQDFDPRAGEPSGQKPGGGAVTDKSTDELYQILFGSARSVADEKATNGSVADPRSAEELKQAMEQEISELDSKMAEMREGFKRGITFGNDDFQMSDFDPIVQTQSVAIPAASL